MRKPGIYQSIAAPRLRIQGITRTQKCRTDSNRQPVGTMATFAPFRHRAQPVASTAGTAQTTWYPHQTASGTAWRQPPKHDAVDAPIDDCQGRKGWPGLERGTSETLGLPSLRSVQPRPPSRKHQPASCLGLS